LQFASNTKTVRTVSFVVSDRVRALMELSTNDTPHFVQLSNLKGYR